MMTFSCRADDHTVPFDGCGFLVSEDFTALFLAVFEHCRHDVGTSTAPGFVTKLSIRKSSRFFLYRKHRIG